MRVVYEKHVVDKIREAVWDANNHGKRIEKIVLTRAEMSELSHYLRGFDLHTADRDRRTEKFMGVRIEEEPKS